MNIKKLLLTCLIFSCFVFTGCTTVPAGSVGIKVYLLGSNKGVDNEVLSVGRYWIGFNEELYIYPTYQINYVFTRDKNEGSPQNEEFTFQTNEGLTCSVDLGVSLHFDEKNIAKMYQTYRKGPEEIRGVVVRNAIRDSLNKVSSTLPVESVYGAKKSELLDKVQEMTSKQLANTGIIIDRISIIGSIRLPNQVKIALDYKVVATQKAQQSENELRRAEAEARKKVAEARGEAEANQIQTNSINDKIIAMKRLENEKLAIEKWNGVLPQVANGSTPFINFALKK